MLEELLLGQVVQQQQIVQHSSITLSDSTLNDPFESTDIFMSLNVDNIIYVLKLVNCQTLSINIYDMRQIFTSQISHQCEYINFSSPFTQNGCTLIKDNNTPYLLVVTQVGHIFYKNLIKNTSNLIKNLMVENIKIKCLVKSLLQIDQFQFYLITNTDLLLHVTLDVNRGEFEKNKYQVSFGTKIFSKLFNSNSFDWSIAFQLNDRQILYFSHNHQFNLLVLNETEFRTIQLICQDRIQTNYIDVFEQKPIGKQFVCYQINDQLKICSIIQNQLNISYVINLSTIQLNNQYYLSSTQNKIILIQGNEIYELDQEQMNLELINENQYSVKGYLCLKNELLLFYKNHVTFIRQITDEISERQKALRNQVQKLQNTLRKEQNLVDEEIIVQSIAFHPTGENKFDQFQYLIKLMHRNLDQKKVLSIMKSQSNSFNVKDFFHDLIFEVEDIYIFIKPAIQNLKLDFYGTQIELIAQLEKLNFNLFQFFEENKYSQQNRINGDYESQKLPVLKSMVVHTLRDYYYMQLEIFLGLGITSILNNQDFNFDIDFKLFYYTILLLSLIQDENLIQIQKILNEQFNQIEKEIQFSNLYTFQKVLKIYINLIFNEIYTRQAIPDKYFCENFVCNQMNFHSQNNDSKGIIRHCRIAQQTNQIPTDVIRYILQNQGENEELKLKISLTIQKQNPKQDDEQDQILGQLIHYAIKLKQYRLLFQIYNLNDHSKLEDSQQLIVDNNSLFKCHLNVRTTDKIGEFLLKYSREKFHILSNKNRILQSFSFLIKMESKVKAYTLLFEYIINLESLLINMQQEDLIQTIRTQLDCINLLTNQMHLLSRQDKIPYAYQIVCKIKDQIYRQFLNPSTVGDLREFDQQSQGNIRVIDFEQIEQLKQYKEIQYFVCQNYSPQAQLQKVIDQLILNNEIEKFIDVGRLKIDPNYEKNVAFCYIWNELSRDELINGLQTILKEKEFSVILAQICVSCNLKTMACKELYRRAKSKDYFLQYLISVDKEHILQEII